MDIVSRLKQFLEATGTSNSTFADTCGIARPTLSQLLNGRNKRVSDEVLSKIHQSYPAINMMWLTFGEGDMFGPNANNDSYAIREATNVDTEESSVGDLSSLSNPVSAQQGSIHFGDEVDDASPVAPSAGRTATAQPIPMQESKPVNAALSPSDGRRIVSITVFYNDNSFETFSPCN